MKKIFLYDGTIEVNVPLTEKYLISLMIKNTLGILPETECMKIIETEKRMDNFDLERSIISMMEC